MKVTSKHYKAGTRCKASHYHADCTGGHVDAGEIVTIEDTKSSKRIGALCKKEDGNYCDVPASLLKRIKPKKPAPSTVPEGCPVDERCHREMTEAGWEWEGCHYKLPMDVGFCALAPTGSAVADSRWLTGAKALAAWRERANR